METVSPAVKEHPEGTIIEIKVHPSSSRRGVGESSGGRIVVSVHSPPEKGKANKETLRVLSDVLGVATLRLEMLRGHNSRNKTILARGISPSEARDRLRIS